MITPPIISRKRYLVLSFRVTERENKMLTFLIKHDRFYSGEKAKVIHAALRQFMPKEIRAILKKKKEARVQ